MSIRVATALLALTCLAGSGHFAEAQETSDVYDENAELPGGNPDVESQLKGEFPPMERGGPVPLGAIQKAWEKAPDTAGIFKVAWSQDHSIKVILREAMTTTIRLPDWETIDRVILGDTRVYRAQQLNDNTETVWAVNPGSDTSLTILGASQNIYVFYLHTETWNSKNIPDLTVIVEAPQPASFTPTDGGAAGAVSGPVSIMGPNESSPLMHLTNSTGPGGKPEWLQRLAFDPARIKRDRALFGDAALAPDDVFRDDQFTYLCYGERWNDADLMVATPAVVTDGVDRPVNFRVKDNCLVIESTGQLSLKHGDSVLCVKPDPNLTSPRSSAAAARIRALSPPPQGPDQTAANRRPTAKGGAPANTLPPAGASQVTPLPPPDPSPGAPTKPPATKDHDK